MNLNIYVDGDFEFGAEDSDVTLLAPAQWRDRLALLLGIGLGAGGAEETPTYVQPDVDLDQAANRALRWLDEVVAVGSDVLPVASSVTRGGGVGFDWEYGLDELTVWFARDGVDRATASVVSLSEDMATGEAGDIEFALDGVLGNKQVLVALRQLARNVELG